MTQPIPPVRPDVFHALRAVIATIDQDGDELDRILDRADRWALLSGLLYVTREVVEFTLGENTRAVLEAMAADPVNDTAGTADAYLAAELACLTDTPASGAG